MLESKECELVQVRREIDRLMQSQGWQDSEVLSNLISRRDVLVSEIENDKEPVSASQSFENVRNSMLY